MTRTLYSCVSLAYLLLLILIRFLHFWLTLLSQTLCMPSKLTTKYWMLTYINGCFSLMQSLIDALVAERRKLLIGKQCIITSAGGLRLDLAKWRCRRRLDDTSRLEPDAVAACCLPYWEMPCNDDVSDLLPDTCMHMHTDQNIIDNHNTFYTVCQKNDRTCLWQIFGKSAPNLIIFGIQIAKSTELCKVNSLSTSRSLWKRTTV